MGLRLLEIGFLKEEQFLRMVSEKKNALPKLEELLREKRLLKKEKESAKQKLVIETNGAKEKIRPSKNELLEEGKLVRGEHEALLKERKLLNKEGFLKEREFLEEGPVEVEGFLREKRLRKKREPLKEKILNRGTFDKRKGFLKEWEFLKRKGYLKDFTEQEIKGFASIIQKLKAVEKKKGSHFQRQKAINQKLKTFERMIGEDPNVKKAKRRLEAIERKLEVNRAKAKAKEPTIIFDHIQIKISNRPCEIYFPEPEQPSLFLDNQKNEPQLLEGEICKIDNRDLKFWYYKGHMLALEKLRKELEKLDVELEKAMKSVNRDKMLSVKSAILSKQAEYNKLKDQAPKEIWVHD